MKRMLCGLVCAAMLLGGCAQTQTQQEIKTIEDLKGKRVGIPLGRNADYALESMPEIRDLMEVARYDSSSDILLALKFHKVNALLMDEPSAQVFMRLQGEPYVMYKGVLPPTPSGFVFSTNPQAREYLEEFNVFIKDFKQTEEYADIMRRTFDLENEPFVPKKIENIVTNDRVIRAVFSDTSEPVSYVDPQTGELYGMSVEIMTHFANSLGARLEITTAIVPTCIMTVNSGKVDVFPFDFTLSGKDMYEMRGGILLSDEVMQKGLAIISKK